MQQVYEEVTKEEIANGISRYLENRPIRTTSTRHNLVYFLKFYLETVICGLRAFNWTRFVGLMVHKRIDYIIRIDVSYREARMRIELLNKYGKYPDSFRMNWERTTHVFEYIEEWDDIEFKRGEGHGRPKTRVSSKGILEVLEEEEQRTRRTRTIVHESEESMEEVEDEREILELNRMEEEGPTVNEIEESWESDEFYDFHSMDYETEESMEQEEVQFLNSEQEQEHKIAKEPTFYERERFVSVSIPEKQRVSNAETILLSDKEEIQEERRLVQEQEITRTYSEDLFLYFCTQQHPP
ncbi:hypothetical protein HMI54_012950, partial [Coelomomyces lativittatus]